MTRTITHLRANIIGYVSLFFALSAGAYAATLEPNSVRSSHIKNGQVRSADIADGSVVGTDVADQGLTGFDVATDSLQGQDIQESSLGEVPRATIAGHGGYGRTGDQTNICHPDDDIYTTCASVGLTPSAPGRVLLVATLRFNSYAFNDDDAAAECRLGSSRSGGISGTNTQLEYKEDGLDPEVTLHAVTDVYQPGNHSFGIDCKHESGLPEIYDARISAVVISPF